MSTTIRARRATVRASWWTGPIELECWRIGPFAITEHDGYFDVLVADCGMSVAQFLSAKNLAFDLARAILLEVPVTEWPRLDDPDPQAPLYESPEYRAWVARVSPIVRDYYESEGMA